MISLDDLRGALSRCGCPNAQDTTPIAVAAAFAAARHALTAGQDVLWDATNATTGRRDALLRLAAETGSGTAAVVLLPPLQVALARNAARSDSPCSCGWPRRVPADVVTSMHAAITADLPGLPAAGWGRTEIYREH